MEHRGGTGSEETGRGIRQVGHWIGGRLEDTGRRTGPVFDPSAGEVIAEVRFGDAEVVHRAVQVAERAQRAWAETSLAQRAAVLFAFRERLRARTQELARVVSREHGKTVADAEGEVARGLEVVELACGVPHLAKGEFSEQVSRGVDTYSVRQPLGVVAGITPFNFPAMVPLWMCPVAVALGNAFVLKPSEKDPSASLVLAECWEEAGLPPGVFQVVQGDGEVVEAILAHPGVAAVSFVGSTPVARRVYEAAAAAGKRVQALGGAKNHMVVCPDADLDEAAAAAVSAGFGSAGERCMAVSVVVALEPVGDALVERIAKRMAEVRVGPGDRPGVEMGPLVTREHRDRVAGYLDKAAEEGARVVVDGRRHPVEGPPRGFWLGPSLVDEVRPGMAVYDDEIFGPVLAVVRVADLDDALELLRANPYGNGAAIFTRSGALARRFAREAPCGMVGVNVPIPVPVGTFPFGGWKQSLFGDTHVYGRDAVHFYSRGKVVTSRWVVAGSSEVRMAFPAASGDRSSE
ncbi:CoA-acylating methylmalonate-semialdehyde dehydrogenase [Aciditerrimonas ferrireducens]|uniref:methylmalonate-semialdehyde dehydrogenase (CoA acylating) n=1 Tax=Aciditerrimonas ferrireducens TaxID=667306 RepID=A0ABV6BYY6_9ACTN|nr:CoA-acylating methylmalonate-semialdehyde dehydrogenase [Aciditerrimonas ferrireducens]MCK4176889.1 CoA-acylating methylmalonate-semialdehyde dehydrogenase [Aciditerrimonas ferrireducens]